MDHRPESLIKHFAPLDDLLAGLKLHADVAFQEGGLGWKVEYGRRKHSLAKLDQSELLRASDAQWAERSEGYIQKWARLIWSASAEYGKLPELAGGKEWDDEENRLIANRVDDAANVVALFGTAGANPCVMSFREDATSMQAVCTLVFPNHVLKYDIFWSVD